MPRKHLLFNFLPIILLLSIFSMVGLAQSKKIDSIRNLINKPGFKADTSFINQLNSIGKQSRIIGTAEVKYISDQALVLSNRIHYKYGIANANLNLGSAIIRSNNDAKALNYLENALNLFTELKSTKGLFDTYYMLGWYYGGIQDFKTELSFYQDALKELKKLNNPYEEAMLVNNLASSYEDQKDYLKAEKYYYSVLSSSKKLKKTDLGMDAYTGLSSVNNTKGEFKEGLYFARLAMRKYKENKEIDYTILDDIENQLGKALINTGNIDEGSMHLNKAILYARKINDLAEVAAGMKNRFKLDSIQGNTLRASQDIGEYTRLHDSLLSVKYNGIVAYYQTKFDLGKRKAENDILKEKDLKNDSLIMALRVSLVVVVGFFFLIVVFFFNLKSNNRRTEKLGQLNNQLFSIISHDLRIPFMQVTGLIGLIETNHLSKKEFIDFIPQLKDQTDITLSLLDNILVWSKNQMKGFIPRKESFEIANLIQENADLQAFRILGKKITLGISVSAELKVNADKEMTNIVLRNLLSNAIKFTPENGKIEISAIPYKNKEIVVSITDSGLGIKTEDLDKIFKVTNFTRAGTNNEKGTGMGLKLCKDLLELNEGSIWMESKFGKGSTFSFSIPAAS